MRVHTNFEQFQFWRDEHVLRAFARPENVTAVRLEPVIRQRIPTTVADIVFRTDGGYLTIPCILIDAPQVVLREADRFVWPSACAAGLNDARAHEIEARLMPWLRSITLGRALTEEVVRHFGDEADQEAFQRARARSYAGAARLCDVVKALSPYVFVARHAAGGTVEICGAPDAMQGAAYLSRFAKVSIDQIPAPERDEGVRWFAPALPDFVPGEAAVKVIGPQASGEKTTAGVCLEIDASDFDGAERVVFAHAYPTDFLFTQDSVYGPAVRESALTIEAAQIAGRAVHPSPHVSLGGSGGRILFGVRSDWQRTPDADVESALELAGLLRSEGFHVDVTGEPATSDYGSYDIVHVFNVLDVKTALNFLARAKDAGIPAVLTANFLDLTEDRTWGAETAPTCFRQEMDEANIARYLSFMGRRALLTPGWESRSGGPFAEYAGLISDALRIADMVIAESQQEEELLRRFGRTGPVRVVEPFIETPRGTAQTFPPVGLERFVLVHAPIDARGNQLMAIRAARLAGVDLVLVGPDGDMEYAARVREFAGDRVFFVDGCGPKQIEWLYNAAETILDPSWYSYGTGRLYRAVLSGARVCASEFGWGPMLFGPEIQSVDPASPDRIAEVLSQGGAAPSRQTRERLAQRLEVSALLKNTIGAYLSLTNPSAVG